MPHSGVNHTVYITHVTSYVFFLYLFFMGTVGVKNWKYTLAKFRFQDLFVFEQDSLCLKCKLYCCGIFSCHWTESLPCLTHYALVSMVCYFHVRATAQEKTFEGSHFLKIVINFEFFVCICINISKWYWSYRSRLTNVVSGKKKVKIATLFLFCDTFL